MRLRIRRGPQGPPYPLPWNCSLLIDFGREGVVPTAEPTRFQTSKPMVTQKALFKLRLNSIKQNKMKVRKRFVGRGGVGGVAERRGQREAVGRIVGVYCIHAWNSLKADLINKKIVVYHSSPLLI